MVTCHVSTLLAGVLAIHLSLDAVAQDVATDTQPAKTAATFVLGAGDLRLTINGSPQGICVTSLLDTACSAELLPAQPEPLFLLTLRDGPSGQEIRLDAASGWAETETTAFDSPARLQLRWQRALDPQLDGIRVIAQAISDPQLHAIRWQLKVENDSTRWSVWRVDFPRIAVNDLGPDAEVFFPRGPGEVQRALWQTRIPVPRHVSRRVDDHAVHGRLRCVAKDWALRGVARPAGQHQGSGGREPARRRKAVAFRFDQPAEDMGRAGNDFAAGGEAIWRLLRGDWFDAAVFYRDWVRAQACWHPARVTARRTDTRAGDARVRAPGQSAAVIRGLPEQFLLPNESRRSSSSPAHSAFPWACTGTVGTRTRSTMTTRTTCRPSRLQGGRGSAANPRRLRDAVHQRSPLGHARPGRGGSRVQPTGSALCRQG